MKKVAYILTVTILTIVGLPFMIFARNKWNSFGRKVDEFFGIDSYHTKKYKKEHE